ncbi:MAG TPA: hypothetical protein VFU00_07225, partial [Gemmatimonadales bacterium]|nr:hypothetical protein [Gemmatimonadales bacterium]
VERWPGLARVRLYTRRHDRLAAASHILLAAGPKKEAAYQATLERRFLSGFGFAAGADYLKVPVPSGGSGEFKATKYWGQISFVPSATFGAQLQYFGTSADRDAFSDLGPPGERYEGGRGDLQARVFLGGGGTPRLDLNYMRTAFDSAGILQRIGQLGGTAAIAGATWAFRGTARHTTRWTPLAVDASLSWTPLSLVTFAAEGAYRTHSGDRSSRWGGVRAGIALPGGLVASGSLRRGDAVANPALAVDAAQDIDELEGSIGWQLPWVGIEASYARTAAFTPRIYQAFPSIASIGPSARTEWITLGGRFSPLDWISVQGWYSNPRGAVPDGLPPRHYQVTGALHSKFLRTFRSGVFDLRLELGIEGWRAGVIGRDPLGAPVVLPSATHVRSLVRLQIDTFSLFWESRNLGDTQTGHVPGFRIPRYSGLFGVRWGFVN